MKRLTGILLASLLLAACGRETYSVGDAEEVLADHYLDPLKAAGIPAIVEDTCRYNGPVDVSWHLMVTLRLTAAQDKVADLLEREGMWVVRDRPSMIVQQNRKMACDEDPLSSDALSRCVETFPGA